MHKPPAAALQTSTFRLFRLLELTAALYFMVVLCLEEGESQHANGERLHALCWMHPALNRGQAAQARRVSTVLRRIMCTAAWHGSCVKQPS